MNITITKTEQIGPTVGIWGQDEKGRKGFTQIIDLPATKEGIFSALHTAITAPPFIEPPSEPGGVEPVEFEPVEIPAEKLDAAAAKKAAIDKGVKTCVFEDEVEVEKVKGVKG